MKKLYFLIISLLIINIANAQWIQMGSDINSDNVTDKLGISVSISSDGMTLAAGGSGNDAYASEAGYVKVFDYNGANWIQKGNSIYGEAVHDFSGYSISLSSDGNKIAISSSYSDSATGHVRVFEYISGNWVQLGNNINGEATLDQSGWSISLSSDGTILAIGAYQNDGIGIDAGHVRVYEYIGGNWTQIGSDIDGEVAGDESGRFVDLNSDGTIIAIGAHKNDGNGDQSGHVRVFEYSGGNWVQLGSDIDGEDSLDWSGYSVGLNSDGTILAIGSVLNFENGIHAGQVRIYEFNGGNWIQKGTDLHGEGDSDAFGKAVDLSSDGNIVAIGGCYNSIAAGHVKVFEYVGSNWIQINNDIIGEAPEDYSGYSICLSSDASIVAIGAYGNDFNDGYDSKRGQVRVYGNPSVGINENIINTEVSIYPNPTTGKITVKTESIEKIDVMDLQGQSIINTVIASKAKQSANNSEIATGYCPRNVEIDLSTQPKGIYIIKVTTNKGVAVRKVVLE